MRYRAYTGTTLVGTIELDVTIKSPPSVIEDQYGRTWKLVIRKGSDFFGIDEPCYEQVRKVSAHFLSHQQVSRRTRRKPL